MKWDIEKGAASTADHAKCIRLSALTVVKKRKYPSNQQTDDQSTVKNALPNIGHLEGIKPDS